MRVSEILCIPQVLCEIYFYISDMACKLHEDSNVHAYSSSRVISKSENCRGGCVTQLTIAHHHRSWWAEQGLGWSDKHWHGALSESEALCCVYLLFTVQKLSFVFAESFYMKRSISVIDLFIKEFSANTKNCSEWWKADTHSREPPIQRAPHVSDHTKLTGFSFTVQYPINTHQNNARLQV